MPFKSNRRLPAALTSLCGLLATLAIGQTPADKSATGAGVNAEVAAAQTQSAAVKFRGNVLFVVSAPIGALSVAERVAAIEQRLARVAGGPENVMSALRVTEGSGVSELRAGDIVLRTVTDQDAANTGRTRQQLAADQLEIVRSALQVEFHGRGIASLMRAAVIGLVATLLLAVALLGLTRLRQWLRQRIASAAVGWRWHAGLANLKLLSPEAVANASRTTVHVACWLIGLVLAYFYLGYTLSLFPWTRGIAARMVEALTKAVVGVLSGLIAYVPSLLNIVVIVVVARLLLRALRSLFDHVAAGRVAFQGFRPEWSAPTYSLTRFLVIAVAAVMIFPYLPGSGSEGFKGVSTFLGLAISFGGAPAIANMVAGVIITYMRPFGIGDRVKIADAVGDVLAKNLLVVRLRTIKNVEITIPNALVLANHIVNYSANARDEGLILHTTVTIGYDAPWQKVHELLIDAAKRTNGVLATPAPFVLQTRLDDFYVAYEINAYTDRPNEQAVLYSRLHAEIQNAFNAAGVEITSPHFAAVRDGNAMAVPDAYLPKDYRAPGFNLLSRVLRPGQST